MESIESANLHEFSLILSLIHRDTTIVIMLFTLNGIRSVVPLKAFSLTWMSGSMGLQTAKNIGEN